jgi:hypothetical protein
MSPVGNRVTYCGATICPKLKIDRKWSAQGQADAIDPGCVKTLYCCYDSRGDSAGGIDVRFVEEADRGQWTLLSECLDDFIDERTPFA